MPQHSGPVLTIEFGPRAFLKRTLLNVAPAILVQASRAFSESLAKNQILFDEVVLSKTLIARHPLPEAFFGLRKCLQLWIIRSSKRRLTPLDMADLMHHFLNHLFCSRMSTEQFLVFITHKLSEPGAGKCSEDEETLFAKAMAEVYQDRYRITSNSC